MKICNYCGKKFEKSYNTSRKEWANRVFCSLKCHHKNGRPDMLGDKNPARRPGMGKRISNAKRGWNGLIGHHHSEETKKRIGMANMREVVGVSEIHRRIEKKLGKPKLCDICKTTTAKKFEWANKKHTYKEDVSDWLRLCTKCHRNFDLGKIVV